MAKKVIPPDELRYERVALSQVYRVAERAAKRRVQRTINVRKRTPGAEGFEFLDQFFEKAFDAYLVEFRALMESQVRRNELERLRDLKRWPSRHEAHAERRRVREAIKKEERRCAAENAPDDTPDVTLSVTITKSTRKKLNVFVSEEFMNQK